MAQVDVCPGNLTAITKASQKLGCGNDEYENNQYLCVPNVDKSSLVEFCYDGIIGYQEKGIFLKLTFSTLINFYYYYLVILFVTYYLVLLTYFQYLLLWQLLFKNYN